jgi:hypothetical protein
MPFAVSVCIYPLKQSNPGLFDTLMGETLVTSTVVLACLYLRRAAGRFPVQGIKIGVLWMLANWALDGVMFSAGPMKMSFDEYAIDIGIAYFLIPVMTIGLGAAATLGRAAR